MYIVRTPVTSFAVSWLNFEPWSRSFPVKISRKGYFYFYYVEIRVLFFSFFYIGVFLLRDKHKVRSQAATVDVLLISLSRNGRDFSTKKDDLSRLLLISH